MLTSVRRLVVATVLLFPLVACNAVATATVAKKCASAAEEGNKPEDIQAEAEERGVGRMAEALVANVEEFKAYDWATCMMDNDYRCSPPTLDGPPKRCSDHDTFVDNPFVS